jgi:hypothetical protein
MAANGPGLTIATVNDRSVGSLNFGRWITKFNLAFFEKGRKGAPSFRKTFTGEIYGFIVDKINEVKASNGPIEKPIVVTTFNKDKKPVTDFIMVIRKNAEGIYSISLKDANTDVTLTMLIGDLVRIGNERLTDKERSEYAMQDLTMKLAAERVNMTYPLIFDMYQAIANGVTNGGSTDKGSSSIDGEYTFG